MRKNMILLCLTTVLCSAQYCFAADAISMQVRSFEAEGVMMYYVKGCVPGSNIMFYSMRDGGSMLKDVTVNGNGSAKVAWDTKILPALVLNTTGINSAGIGGNGFVTYTGDKEFTLNSVALTNNAGSVTLKWNAAVSIPSHYSFQVLKSINGGAYSVIQTVNAQSAALMPYTYADPELSLSATYQINVIDNNGEVYYSSNPLYADGISGVSLYPTVTHSNINVRLSDNTGSGTYKIINLQGQVMTTGSLNGSSSSLSVSSLPAGDYLIEIISQAGKTTQKFVKE